MDEIFERNKEKNIRTTWHELLKAAGHDRLTPPIVMEGFIPKTHHDKSDHDPTDYVAVYYYWSYFADKIMFHKDLLYPFPLLKKEYVKMAFHAATGYSPEEILPHPEELKRY